MAKVTMQYSETRSPHGNCHAQEKPSVQFPLTQGIGMWFHNSFNFCFLSWTIRIETES